MAPKRISGPRETLFRAHKTIFMVGLRARPEFWYAQDRITSRSERSSSKEKPHVYFSLSSDMGPVVSGDGGADCCDVLHASPSTAPDKRFL
jgi:hypothetical protein